VAVAVDVAVDVGDGVGDGSDVAVAGRVGDEVAVPTCVTVVAGASVVLVAASIVADGDGVLWSSDPELVHPAKIAVTRSIAEAAVKALRMRRRIPPGTAP
jgi:hypothetical protein